MKRIYIPTTTPEDWRPLLAEPNKHWKRGYSARTLAYCWETEKFPKEIRQLLQPQFPEIELLMALPEHQTPLPGGRHQASHTDLFVLAKANQEPIAITVEGKVTESFGQIVARWFQKDTPGKQARLASLCEMLGLNPTQVKTIRYQLLHRTGAALLEAQRFNATAAVMLVHSFSTENAGLEDYLTFLKLLGVEGGPNSLSFVRRLGSIALYLGWAKGDSKYLEM